MRWVLGAASPLDLFQISLVGGVPGFSMKKELWVMHVFLGYLNRGFLLQTLGASRSAAVAFSKGFSLSLVCFLHRPVSLTLSYVLAYFAWGICLHSIECNNGIIWNLLCARLHSKYFVCKLIHLNITTDPRREYSFTGEYFFH